MAELETQPAVDVPEDEACEVEEEDEDELLACADDGGSSDDESDAETQEEQEEHKPPPQGAADEGRTASSKYEEVLQQMMGLPISQLKKLVVKAHSVVGVSTKDMWHLMSQLPLVELESLASRAREAVEALRAGIAGEGSTPDCEGSEAKASSCGDSAQPICPTCAVGLLILLRAFGTLTEIQAR